MNYVVKIAETLEMTVPIKADSPCEAEVIARSKWTKGEYVLTADNFTDVKFSAMPEKP